MEAVVSALRIAVGTTILAFASLIAGVILVILLPSRGARIRFCNQWGHVMGPIFLAIAGCPLTVRGREHLDPRRKAIYVTNHTSIADMFVTVALAPLDTVGVVRRGIEKYPFFGQVYLLSGHLILDRDDRSKAVAEMKALASDQKKYDLSIWIWPEGTRSASGRLLPFKKGPVHLALQTGLPIVPVVVTGAHKVWPKGTTTVHSVPIGVEVLPAIDTSTWTIDEVDSRTQEIHDLFVTRLPPEQQPAAPSVG